MSISKILVSAAAALTLSTGAVLAGSAAIERAKDQCLIGEQANGYLGVVTGKSVSTELQREMREINQQRKAAYGRTAQRNGVSVDVTAAIAAEKLINRASRGECVRDQSGKWLQL